MLNLLILSALWLGVYAGTKKKMEEMIERPQFTLQTKVQLDVEHEVVIAVKQRNLDQLHDVLMERSSPRSPTYQQWLTFEEVGAMTSNVPAANAVKAWLAESGASVTWVSAHQDYIKATATVGVWENLLSASFYYYHDVSNLKKDADPKIFIRSKEYSIPDSLDEHIECIFNTVQAPPVISKGFHVGPEKKKFKTLLRGSDLKLDSTFTVPDVTVAFLDSYYGITSNIGNANQNQSVFETSSEYFSPTDLASFQTYYGLTNQKAIDIGGFKTSSCSLTGTGNDCSEGNLDIQYIMGISQVTSSIYWYVPGSPTDPFMAWITDVADESNPPQSNSISWGGIEQAYPTSTTRQFNTEALKLSSMGVTITVSSGDNGVSGTGCYCTTSSSSSVGHWGGSNTWTGSGYFPSFPASCPYVTAVGATMFSPSSTRPETSCQADKGGVITTGGGFSTYYAQPSWQTAAVNSYFSSLSTQPQSGYNIQGRGYPDISLLGVNYQVVIQGYLVPVYGTSASSPVFAGMISLINAARYAQGKTNVGFINPTLYEYGISDYHKYFNDVTIGNNTCCSSSFGKCCTAGFKAAPGWDPVTGWGSINFANLTALLNPPSGTPTVSPALKPTRAPATYGPTPTAIPSRGPTLAPIPPAGAPTVAPTTSNIVVADIRQLVSSAVMSASIFNNNPWNSYTFQQAVSASISSTQAVTITSVKDYDPTYYSYYYYYYYTSNPSVVVEYTVTTNSYASVQAQIDYSVQSGNFTSYLQYYAAQNGATDLTTASSSAVVVTSIATPLASPTSSPKKALLSKAGIIAVVVIGFVVIAAVVGVVYWFCFRGRSSSSYSPSSVPQSENRATAVEMSASTATAAPPAGTPSSVSDPPTGLFNNPMKPVMISPPKTPPKPPKANKAAAKKAFQKGNTRDYI